MGKAQNAIKKFNIKQFLVTVQRLEGLLIPCKTEDDKIVYIQFKNKEVLIDNYSINHYNKSTITKIITGFFKYLSSLDIKFKNHFKNNQTKKPGYVPTPTVVWVDSSKNSIFSGYVGIIYEKKDYTIFVNGYDTSFCTLTYKQQIQAKIAVVEGNFEMVSGFCG